MRGIEEAAHRFPRGFVALCSFGREVVNAAVDIRIFTRGKFRHRGEHRARLLRRCGVVEIYKRFAVDLPRKDFEFRAGGMHVEDVVASQLKIHEPDSSACARPLSRKSRTARRTSSRSISKIAYSRKPWIRRRRASSAGRPREQR